MIANVTIVQPPTDHPLCHGIVIAVDGDAVLADISADHPGVFIQGIQVAYKPGDELLAWIVGQDEDGLYQLDPL